MKVLHETVAHTAREATIKEHEGFRVRTHKNTEGRTAYAVSRRMVGQA